MKITPITAAITKSISGPLGQQAAALKKANETLQAEIADRWGALKRRAAKIDDEIEALKAEFERRELLSAKGLKFTIVKSVRGFASLDVKAIRAEARPGAPSARNPSAAAHRHLAFVCRPNGSRTRPPG